MIANMNEEHNIMDNNQWNAGQPYSGQPQYNQQPQFGQQMYGQQSQPGLQPTFNQPQYGNNYPNTPFVNPYSSSVPSAPVKSKKGPIIAGISVAVLLVIFFVVGVIVTRGGYRIKTCENCKESKKCKEYTLTGFGMSDDFWVCDDCYDECKARAEYVGGSLKPKK